MTTVKDVNEIFIQQKLYIKLPYPEDWLVQDMEILEKKDFSNSVHVLLGLKLINDKGKTVSDLYFAESELTREPIYKIQSKEMKKDLLPQREETDFKDEDEARRYLETAILSLIREKGYVISDTDTDLYGEKEGRGFYIHICPRSDHQGSEKANALIDLRNQFGDAHDYGIVMPTFQESLGISRMDQDEWMNVNINRFSNNHIGVFAVDNNDPNTIYPLTVYPKEKELRIYFIRTSSKWTLLKSRLMKERSN